MKLYPIRNSQPRGGQAILKTVFQRIDRGKHLLTGSHHSSLSIPKGPLNPTPTHIHTNTPTSGLHKLHATEFQLDFYVLTLKKAHVKEKKVEEQVKVQQNLFIKLTLESEMRLRGYEARHRTHLI